MYPLLLAINKVFEPVLKAIDVMMHCFLIIITDFAIDEV
jgi:hypothetical protein